MNLGQVKAFLVVAEELHFGRSAERLYLSQGRVSRLVASLESEIGGTLFERSSRSVRLTPLGVRFRHQLEPAYALMQTALDNARRDARQATGALRIGFTLTTGGPTLSHVVERFQTANPGSELTLHEVEIFCPVAALRRGDVDVLCDWALFGETDLTVGATLAYYERALAVSPKHTLASRAQVCVEDLASCVVAELPDTVPAGFVDAWCPRHTPSGRPIARTPQPVRTVNEILSLVALGRLVHPTSAAVALFDRDDLVLIPFSDMPKMPLALIWLSSGENARIRAFAEAAEE